MSDFRDFLWGSAMCRGSVWQRHIFKIFFLEIPKVCSIYTAIKHVYCEPNPGTRQWVTCALNDGDEMVNVFVKVALESRVLSRESVIE